MVNCIWEVETMHRKIIGILVCMLLVGTVLPASGTMMNDNINEENFIDLDSQSGKYRWGFIVGPIDSINYEGDIIILGGGDPIDGNMGRGLRFFIPISKCRVLYKQQIKIQFKFGILRNDFVIGFSRIYVPESEISMHIVSHDDLENNVVWEVDEIIGDPIWESNIDVRLYNVSGDEYIGKQWGPLGCEYLDVGDQIYIKLNKPESDGYYKVQFCDMIFGNVLFEMDSVKF